MNDIHPTVVISGEVVLGVGNTIGPHVVIYGPATIGDRNWIGTGVVIGAPPEVRSFEHPRGEETPTSGAGVRIGDRNVIREYAQIHQGWKTATVVGDDAFIMNQVYVAHDCQLGDEVTLASSVLLAGHVRVSSGVNLGLGTTVHQFRYIGRGAMVGMGSVVTRDIPPFAKAYGSPARVASANTVGLRRLGAAEELINRLETFYESGNADAELSSFVHSPVLDDAVAEWQARADTRR
ncbi:UDP-N-acetylglucosamine acyltransferase [Agromyces ramosus]|uniref:UDP-N-acetylglucosamine acyltransferase n=1 Tax=Agromyces ramosus TaxID=33879 RepID=A0ABU0REE0_9MICO|nr:UDP-N-acetylglucosamine acyltransferase [Agromyces ramosus]MDQ0895419.1 UDP-N-acetylglucosamine acyltransferase [Agromyces ramosus]